ncbi:MAG TPA: tryptophan halogenase family protein [Polyangiaceae bacterium]|nr:tryptophan halogenase family protein [Polyangiaceae bacterium]
MPGSRDTFNVGALRVAPDASLAVSATGAVHALVGERVFALDGAPASLVRAALAFADGTRDLASVVAAVDGSHPSAHAARAEELVRVLVKSGVLVPVDAPARAESIVVLGNGALAAAIDGALAAAGYATRNLVRVSRFASLERDAFRERRIEPKFPEPAPNVALRASEQERSVDGSDGTLELATDENLREALRGFDVAVCALESVPYEALLVVNRAALEADVPALFVTTGGVGPVVVRGSACLSCRLLQEHGALETLPYLVSPRAPDEAAAAAVATAAVLRLVAPDRSTAVLRFRDDGGRSLEPLLSQGGCAACAAFPDGKLPTAVAEATALSRLWPMSPHTRASAARDPYRTVGIVGGGTAGYLTALALRKLRPELDVTLIESSKIPVIGVGEATTPELVKFLHSPRFLDRDVGDLYRRVRPTWKLGIKFRWGPRDFTFPFQRGRLLESKLYDGHLNRQSLGALLMMADRVPIFRDEAGRHVSMAHLVRWAYHLENRKFVRYLAEEAVAAGVHYVDATIANVERTSDGNDVAALVTEDGRRLSFDLFVDTSGFRSLLLEKTLESKFIDWSSTLFTDGAVIATVPHDGTVKPYTLAETMDAGWCWNIPFEAEDHRGYVFSSRFLSKDEAEAEMRTKNPQMGDAGFVRFRSGRHDAFWKGNVVALGNAYGFVEPLESTAIHMMVLTLELLTTHFPESKSDRSVVATLNRKIAERWDALRWFLGVHYRFNKRRGTPFWRAANNDVDISGAAERVALFERRAPLSYRTSLFYTVIPPEYFSDDHSFDTLLMGQDVATDFVAPAEDRPTWNRRMTTLEGLKNAALPQADALAWLRDHPEELARLRTAPDSWLHGWIPA